MKKTNKKDQIKLLLLNTLFFSQNDELLLKNLFNFIDSMNQTELEKTKMFLEKNQHTKSFEENRDFYKLVSLEIVNDIRTSTLFVIFILLKIAQQERYKEIRFIINEYLEQENYKLLLHRLEYVFFDNIHVERILNNINKSYNKKNIFQKFKDLILKEQSD